MPAHLKRIILDGYHNHICHILILQSLGYPILARAAYALGGLVSLLTENKSSSN